MTLTALRADALTTTPDGFELRLSLPWIRALPLRSLGDVTVQLDDAIVDDVRVPNMDDRWWPAQDRVVLRCGAPIAPGNHDVVVDFTLVIPYLQITPDGPLRLPFREQRTLCADVALPSVSEDIA